MRGRHQRSPWRYSRHSERWRATGKDMNPGRRRTVFATVSFSLGAGQPRMYRGLDEVIEYFGRVRDLTSGRCGSSPSRFWSATTSGTPSRVERPSGVRLHGPGRVTGLVDPDQVDHGVDQGQVGEGLGEVAEVTSAARVELLGV